MLRAIQGWLAQASAVPSQRRTVITVFVQSIKEEAGQRNPASFRTWRRRVLVFGHTRFHAGMRLSPVFLALLILLSGLGFKAKLLRDFLILKAHEASAVFFGQRAAKLLNVGLAVTLAIAFAVTGVSPAHMAYLIGCWSLVGTLLVVVFFLPSNFGFTEVGLSLLLSAVMPSSLAVLVAVLSRLFTMGFELLAAGLALPLIRWFERRRTTQF